MASDSIWRMEISLDSALLPEMLTNELRRSFVRADLEASSFRRAECDSVTVCTGALTGTSTNTASAQSEPESGVKLTSIPRLFISGTAISNSAAALLFCGIEMRESFFEIIRFLSL